MSQIYIAVLLLSLSAIATAAFYLLRFAIPKEDEMKNCQLARTLLVCAYFIIVAANIAILTLGQINSDLPYSLVFTLLISSFEAFLFNTALIALIHRNLVKGRIRYFQIIVIGILSAILLTAMFTLPPDLFMVIFYICLSGYVVQLTYYVYRFLKEFNHYCNRLDNFFSDDESQRISWIRNSFFMALSVGILSLIALFIPSYLYIAYVVAFTVFYVYFAAKIITYFSKYHQISPAESFIAISVPQENIDMHRGMELIAPALEKWIESKGYIQQGITLKTLASKLCTNQTYLSAYINSSTGYTFRNWISMLRVEEARRLLLEQDNIPVSYIGEKVGIPNKSSFFRQFVNITGKPPGSYRDEFFSSKAGW